MMIASKRFRYATRALQPGDNFEASRRDAKILRAIGKAEYGAVSVEDGKTSTAGLFGAQGEQEKIRKPRAKKGTEAPSELAEDTNPDQKSPVDPDSGAGTD